MHHNDFTPEDFTLGVEEEYQLVDADTGELRSRARAVIASDWTGEIKPEMQQNTVEVETKVCTSAVTAREELKRLRFQAAIAAQSSGLRAVAAGTHPFSHWAGQEFTADPMYLQLRREYRRLAESQNLFGLHIHVGIPDGVDRVRVTNVARHYLPYLLALTASSPFFLGDDTGYASYRSILWRRWPRTGAPPRFESEGEFERFVQMLMKTGRISAPGRIYWDLRPHHCYPTVEFRVADVTPRLEDTVAVAALTRALVAGVVQGELAEPQAPDAFVHSFLVENRWSASRYGLDAEFVMEYDGSPAVASARDAIRDLVKRLAPVAAGLGDEDALASVAGLLERGEAASRLRRLNNEQGVDMPGLVQWLADETVLGLGLDRRREQRNDG